MPASAHHSTPHQLEHALWLKELNYLNDEINILKHHLSDLNNRHAPEDVKQLAAHFNESFRLQKKWLHKMKTALEPGKKNHAVHNESGTDDNAFQLQMQVNRIVNQELKNRFLNALVKWM